MSHKSEAGNTTPTTVVRERVHRLLRSTGKLYSCSSDDNATVQG